MAEPDCGICEASGYRACDDCGTPIFDNYVSPLGRELCGYCRPKNPDDYCKVCDSELFPKEVSEELGLPRSFCFQVCDKKEYKRLSRV